MANKLVKITHFDEGDHGEPIPEEDQVWCLVVVRNGDSISLCSGQYFTEGAGNARGITKSVKRGGITCKTCLKLIAEIKAVRL